MLARKFAAMAADPFAFLRATAMLGHRAVDLAALPATPLGWICGDLHLQNFGCFRGANRLVYFDLNDFDEAARLPVSLDLLRFLGSIYTAAPALGLDRTGADTAVRAVLAAYAGALARGKAFWLERETADGPIGALLRQVSLRKRQSLLASRTVVQGARRHMRVDGVRYLQVADRAGIRAQIAGALAELGETYGRPEFFVQRDLAWRVAGMGSLGVARFAVLVRGKGDPDRNAIVDFKCAAPSSAAQALPHFAQPAWANEAARVVAIQDICQVASPAYLCALKLGRVAYVVRELQPVEDRIVLGHLARNRNALDRTLQAMATLAAYAQLRSSGRTGAAPADDLIGFGRNLLARPRRWVEAARAVDAANSAAYARYCLAWRKGDPRLLQLCGPKPDAQITSLVRPRPAVKRAPLRTR